MARPTVKVAVLVGFGLIGTVWLFVGYYFTMRLGELEQRSSASSARYLQAQDVLTAARGHILLGAMTVRDALLEGDPGTLPMRRTQVNDSYRAADHALEQYEPVMEPASELARIARLRGDIDDYRRTLLGVLEGPHPVAESAALLREIFPKRQGLMRLSDEMQAINRVAFVQQQSDIAAITRSLHRRVWQSFGLAVTASFGIAVLATLYAGRLERRLRLQRDRDVQNARTLQRLSAQILSVQEEERRVIARELHDEVGQVLTAIKVEIAHAQRAIEHSGGAPGVLDDARSIADGALNTVRHLAHLLHPPLLDDLGLVAAIEWYVRECGKRHALRTELRHDHMEGRLAPEIETGVYRIVQEALTNVVRHAEARSCTVLLRTSDGTLSVIVEDDGRGFDAGRLVDGDAASGLGLVGMRERAGELGGELHIDSSVSRGTRLTVVLPARGRNPASEAASDIEAATAPLVADEALHV